MKLPSTITCPPNGHGRFRLSANVSGKFANITGAAFVHPTTSGFDLHMRVDAVAPGREGVRVLRRRWHGPRENRTYAADLRLLARAAVVRQIDREDRGVAQSLRRDLCDVVDVDRRGAEVRPLALVVPVRPECDVLTTAGMAEVAGVAGRALDAEGRDEPLGECLLEAEALE